MLMKKITLVLMLLSFVALSYGQKIVPSTVNVPYATNKR